MLPLQLEAESVHAQNPEGLLRFSSWPYTLFLSPNILCVWLETLLFGNNVFISNKNSEPGWTDA